MKQGASGLVPLAGFMSFLFEIRTLSTPSELPDGKGQEGRQRFRGPAWLKTSQRKVISSPERLIPRK